MLTLCIADAERDAGMKNLSREEALEILNDMKVEIKIPKAAVTQNKRNAALDMAIDALKYSEIPNGSDDTISRRVAIDALHMHLMYRMGTDSNKKRLDEWINNLPPAQPEQRWIPVSERLPEEREWIGTKTFGTTISDEVYVTFESPKGERFTKHLSFQNGKVSSFTQREIDVFYKGAVPIAWMPLPEPYQGGEKE